MFQTLKQNTNERFAAVSDFFDATKVLRGTPAAAAKGLAFVHMYAVYEFVIIEGFKLTIDSINSRQHDVASLRQSLLAVYLNPELQSLQDCGRRDMWKKRVAIFDKANSSAAANVASSTIPHDGSHFRHSQLLLIFQILGINRIPAQRRLHLYRIDEVVDNRNKVAHGREPAEDVGRSYARSDVRHRIGQMKGVCIKWITTLDEYCSNPERCK